MHHSTWPEPRSLSDEHPHGRGTGRGRAVGASRWTHLRASPDCGGRQPPRVRAQPAVKLAHQPRHQPRHQARHAQPRARRRPRSASAWVGVLVLAGMAMSPEPAAPAAPASHPPDDCARRSQRARRPRRVPDHRRAARPLAPVRGAHAGPRARRGRPLGHRHRLAAVRSGPARPGRRLHHRAGDLRAARHGQPVPEGAGGLGQVDAQRGERVRRARLALRRRPGRGRPRRVLPR